MAEEALRERNEEHNAADWESGCEGRLPELSCAPHIEVAAGLSSESKNSTNTDGGVHAAIPIDASSAKCSTTGPVPRRTTKRCRSPAVTSVHLVSCARRRRLIRGLLMSGSNRRFLNCLSAAFLHQQPTHLFVANEPDHIGRKLPLPSLEVAVDKPG